MNSMLLTSPSMMTRSRASGACPTNRRFRLPKSPDQKKGVVVKGWNFPSMFCAATRPCCIATSQCSIRTRCPVRMAGYAQTSPAAKRLSQASACNSGFTTMAPSLSSDRPSMKRVFGNTPAPTTTASAGSTSPSSSSTPLTASLPRKRRTCDEPNHSTPSFWSFRAKDAPTFLPNTRSKGTDSIAITATSQPFLANEEATSMPMKEPPTTIIFCPFLANCAIFAASSGVLNVKMFFMSEPGTKSFLGVPPVATRTLS
mmetsp:Transcript_45101/g.105418  ORF Transcript_45101/g.105418 Transcript_45101/m.105418 type:complete len:257 (+) Transcript_45101:237-1007(+)